MSQVSPGWYPDPSGRFAQRYHDGTRWTEHVADADGNRNIDAPEAQAGPASYADSGHGTYGQPAHEQPTAQGWGDQDYGRRPAGQSWGDQGYSPPATPADETWGQSAGGDGGGQSWGESSGAGQSDSSWEQGTSASQSWSQSSEAGQRDQRWGTGGAAGGQSWGSGGAADGQDWGSGGAADGQDWARSGRGYDAAGYGQQPDYGSQGYAAQGFGQQQSQGRPGYGQQPTYPPPGYGYGAPAAPARGFTPTVGLIVAAVGGLFLLASLFVLDFLKLTVTARGVGAASRSFSLGDLSKNLGNGAPAALDTYASFGRFLALLVVVLAILASLKLPQLPQLDNIPNLPIIVAGVCGAFAIWHGLAMLASAPDVDTSPTFGAILGLLGYAGLAAGQFFEQPVGARR